ncbi:MAG TPA: hypothetical protein PKA33_15530 [Amaricoccus sp.]|uniref:hypothetical protein n=1 Tax=Amaricoccus sp. TaxID=1872485 RepID=UPI002C337A77|nr:hypothetical protein [Amaricoccus sp.]HMQ92020.1 hypothetical protein [Amaricoccus sp.]HMR53736.1 hypothetical protein [Amaricoccus sp.]HMU00759.1 hypothetical protein [Amaricoccus sp.]
MMQSNPQALHRALGAISGTLADLVEQVVEAGVDGRSCASNACNTPNTRSMPVGRSSRHVRP